MNTGGGDHPSPPLPAGEYLLQLLRRGPLTPQHPLPHQHHHDPAVASLGPPIQSNGHAHPPFAPHAYIHHRFPPPNPINSGTTVSVPNPDTRSSRNSGENNYRNSPDSSRIGGGYNRALSGNEADYRNSQNLSRVGEGYNKVSNGSQSNSPNSSRMGGGYNNMALNGYEMDHQNLIRTGEGYNRALNGNEANYRNSPNMSRFGEGYNRALNGYQPDNQNFPILSRTGEGCSRALNENEGDYRNSPNSSRFGEGYNRAFNGYQPDNQNIHNLSRTGEGCNRALNGNEGDYRNSPNSSRFGEGNNRALNGYQPDNQNFPNISRTGEGHNRALNGNEGDYRNSPNLSRFGEGYNRALNRYQNSPNPSRIREQNSFQKNSRYSKNQGTGSRTVASKQEVKQSTPGSVKKKSNRNLGEKMNKEKGNSNGPKERTVKYKNEREKDGVIHDRRLSTQLDSPGPPAGSTLPSVSGVEVEESLSELQCEMDENREKQRQVGNEGLIENDSDDGYEQKLGLLEEDDGSTDKKRSKKRDKGCRSDTRGQRVLSQGMRKSYRQIECRSDIDMLNAPLLGIYDSLIPLEEEKIKQKQLLTWLENIVTKEWPEARLYVYGSCANSFGVRNSDIDICLAMKDDDVNKSEVLLKLADILKAEKLENVQALTHARVPIVKLMDPSTLISCDICINNVLAVVNSKLLRDYATIDDRLHQLAFIVKHWAKSRGVNKTYHGTLSSYAYVLMCIHFLQQRRPAILPCLQEMDITYSVVADNVECAFFDQVEKLSGFGSPNRESIGQLVWGFFRYWAFCHDYAHDVISVRVGSMISKQAKDWTRRVSRDCHLICIEDPFETSHDLGRVVDKRSIKVLKEEFERAADILQFDPNPCVTLFEPYVPC